ncbi:MAG: transcription antitermination factor NusB [Terriglobales bacterium]
MTAREAALQMIYALDLGGQTTGQVTEWYTRAHPLPPTASRRAEVLLAAVVERQAEIEALLTQHAIGWRLERMNAVDRCVLKLAVGEMLQEEPASVREIVQAALKLAHKFSQPAAASFIQGLLEAIARTRTSQPEVTPHAG